MLAFTRKPALPKPNTKPNTNKTRQNKTKPNRGRQVPAATGATWATGKGLEADRLIRIRLNRARVLRVRIR